MTRLLLATVACLAMGGMAGCSLLTIKSPERPLSTRDTNARLLTRDVAAQFVTGVGQCAETVMRSQTDPQVQQNMLRWQLAAVADSRRAATQLAPTMALLDSWSLAEQLTAFAAPGAPGGDLFGTHQECVRRISEAYANGNEEVAQRVLSAREFAQYRGFVETYAREHPLQDLKFARASVVELWSRQQNAEVKLIDSVGTIPEAMADVADRVQIYSDTLPSQVMWQTQLALQQSGYSSKDLRVALKELDARLDDLTALADAAPEHAREVVGDLRGSLLDVIARLDDAAAASLARVSKERVALLTDLHAEREATLVALDVQRKEVTADASRIADQIVRSAGEQARRLARTVLSLVIVLAAVVLGLPFAAGYLVGRNRRPRGE
ncbi:MAG: hypothetical protein JSR36_16445 [Proteobacteria bacterium]|nr:hypothetical protein [Pseudomonadota bacterium]